MENDELSSKAVRPRVLAIEPDPAIGRAITRVLRTSCTVVVEADAVHARPLRAREPRRRSRSSLSRAS